MALNTGQRATGGTLAVCAGWSALAALNPTVTYHLGPVLAVLAPGWTRRAAGEPTDTRTHLRALAIGSAAALAATAALTLGGLLRGPTVLGGHHATSEALVLVAATAGLSFVTAAVVRQGRERGSDGDGRASEVKTGPRGASRRCGPAAPAAGRPIRRGR